MNKKRSHFCEDCHETFVLNDIEWKAHLEEHGYEDGEYE